MEPKYAKPPSEPNGLQLAQSYLHGANWRLQLPWSVLTVFDQSVPLMSLCVYVCVFFFLCKGGYEAASDAPGGEEGRTHDSISSPSNAGGSKLWTSSCVSPEDKETSLLSIPRETFHTFSHSNHSCTYKKKTALHLISGLWCNVQSIDPPCCFDEALKATFQLC